MAWHAFIRRVRPGTKPGDGIQVEVAFRDVISTPKREYSRGYIYSAGTPEADFRALILADRQKLRSLDAALETLQSSVDTEVT